MVRTVTLFVLALAGVQVAYYYPQLPEYMASNFGGGGEAQAWMSKKIFFVFSMGMMTVLALLFVWMGPILRRMPIWLINLPNRAYWFAPARKEQTLYRMDRIFGWIGISTLVFTLVVCQLVIEANLHPPPRLSDAFLWVFVLYLVGILGSVVWIYRTFGTTPEG